MLAAQLTFSPTSAMAPHPAPVRAHTPEEHHIHARGMTPVNPLARTCQCGTDNVIRR